MSRTTSFVLGDDLDRFVGEQVTSGAYANVSDVIRAALERLAEQKRKEAWVLAAIDAGIASGRATEGAFDRVLARLEALTERQAVGGE